MKNKKQPLTLAIDIGGTGLKMMVIDQQAQAITKRTRVLTPQPATPKAILETLTNMLAAHPNFDRVSIGFPGVVKNGVVETAPNLDPSWAHHDLAKEFTAICQKPTRVCNDADVQGYGDIKGKGVEMMITLGTGMGSAIYSDGKLVPNLELGHHPFHHDNTYEHYLGIKGLEKYGPTKWNEHLQKAIELWQRIFNYDQLYLGGGNAQQINFKLPVNVHQSNNIAGLLGGLKLWE